MAVVDYAASSRTPTQNAPLRVLFVSHTYVVGVNQGKLTAIAQLPQVQVGLLAPSNWQASEWNRRLIVEQPHAAIQFYSAPVQFSGRGGAHFYAPWKIWQVLQDFQPDVVQVEEEVFSLCAFQFAIWAKLTGKKLVIFGWENQPRQFPKVRQFVRDFVLNNAALIIAGNQDGAKILRQWQYDGCIAVMPQMGVDPTLFQPQKSQQRSWVQSAFCIGYLGRLVPEKGIDTILTALRSLKDQGLACRLVLCGTGSGEAEFRQRAETLGIADQITWKTAIAHEQVPEAIASWDVLLLPSRTTATWKEQFGHVLIEAMAMGIPVVGSDSGEIPNVIGRSDVVFPEGDDTALAKILQCLIRDPQWRSELRTYGLNRVQQCYTHDRIAERLMSLWQQILQPPDLQHPGGQP
ncbi:MAG: glycosyltransferase family 4 protein [Oculatellaceae cyanobacterium Prado106]|jgi:glycosyltransferase involved in cell wall biosynthesis|nr:glycosyltransferase family 4 protein [Oculatellaceae cyanobacterium Prado106]